MSSLIQHALPVEGGALPLTVARGAGRGAAVVIVPSAFGVGPDLEAQMTELAAEASLVVAFDPFFRDGRGLIPYEDMAGVMARLRGLDRAQAYRDLRATLDWVRHEGGATRVVALGICFGGALGLTAAADGVVDGLVTWHGSWLEKLLDRVPELRCPVRLHFGSVDPITPPAVLEQLRAAFAAVPEAELFVHDGATHGFSQRRASGAYHEVAERAGMASVVALVAP